MPPLILHNVPEDELYVGEDGVQRPYAMVFPGYASTSSRPSMSFSDDEPTPGLDHTPNTKYRVEHQHNTRSRKPVPETGSFGRSVRRSRSKTGTPARKEDPNLAVADAIFSSYVSNLAKKPATKTVKIDDRPRDLMRRDSQSNISHNQTSTQQEREAEQEARPQHRPDHIHNVATEVLLRGYHETQQYAAISHFERVAGLILEDYPRDAPILQRRFKSDLRDTTAQRPRPLTENERRKAMSFAGGENWIKITFESEEAAEIAIERSPIEISGFMVFAEKYRGVPPTITGEVPAATYKRNLLERRNSSKSSFGSVGARRGSEREMAQRPLATLPRSHKMPGSSFEFESIPESGESTVDTATATMSESPSTTASKRSFGDSLETNNTMDDEVYCRRIPTAKRLQLQPASDALMPKQSFTKKMLAQIPLIGYLTNDIIGSTVPRTEEGEFNWAVASLYWKFIWFLDFYLRIFGGDIAGNNKDE